MDVGREYGTLMKVTNLDPLTTLLNYLNEQALYTPTRLAISSTY